ncbi:ABC transporter permease [Paenibacillus sp. IB182496]|uniref:ABC transporter permease n=1 Tax=Paenibacillus sabuli TaxID=2772509 RepID=A0A927GTP9_9BACL|nr:ABC transporter permease [Paenibacillus sabuli]MBD2847335.1 ABC transporter permease [Paenibacillus sabuli]
MRSKRTEHVEHTKRAESTKHPEHTQHTEYAEHTKHAEHTQHTQRAKYIAQTERAEHTELPDPAEPADHTAPPEHIERTVSGDLARKRMMTPGRLFAIRLRSYYAEQRKVWGSALDWTVWIYLLVPGLFIGGGSYLELIREQPPWLGMIPYAVLPIVLTVSVWIASLRLLLEEADRLFLLQRVQWLSGVARRGIVYTLAVQTLSTLLIYALALPWLLEVVELSPLAVALGLAYTVLFRHSSALLSSLLSGRMGAGWRKWLRESALLLVLGAGYLLPMLAGRGSLWLLVCACAVAAVLWLFLVAVKWRRAIGSFEQDVAAQRRARLRSTELLMSQVVSAKPLIRVAKPLMFRHSGRLLRGTDGGTMLAEMRLKAFVRRFETLRLWLGFLSMGATAIALCPPPLAAALLPMLTLMGAGWLGQQWKQWIEEPFIARFGWTDVQLAKGRIVSRCWLLLPPVAVWSAVAGWLLLPLWGGLLGLLTGPLICWALHRTGAARNEAETFAGHGK